MAVKRPGMACVKLLFLLIFAYPEALSSAASTDILSWLPPLSRFPNLRISDLKEASSSKGSPETEGKMDDSTASSLKDGQSDGGLGFVEEIASAIPNLFHGVEKTRHPDSDGDAEDIGKTQGSDGSPALSSSVDGTVSETRTPGTSTTTSLPALPTESQRSDSFFSSDFLSSSETESSTSAPIPTPPPGQSAFSTGNLLILSSCLLACFFAGYLTHTRKIRHLPDSAGAMLVGVAFGLCIRLYDSLTAPFESSFANRDPFSSGQHLPISTAADRGGGSLPLSALYFDPQFFYLVLLPPIVLDAGLSIPQYNFVRNGGPILLFAFAGTLISTLLIFWGLQFANSRLADLGLQGPPHKVRAFLWAFAALISATDTVAVMNLLNSPRFFTKMRNNKFVHSLSPERYGGQQVVRGGGLVYARNLTGEERRTRRRNASAQGGPEQGKDEMATLPHRQPLWEQNANSIFNTENQIQTGIHHGTASDNTLENPGRKPSDLALSESQMQHTQVNSNLVSILMGESILNDAVCIALTRSVFKFFFSDDPAVVLNAGVADVVADFAFVLTGSLVLGIGIGALCCFCFKHSQLRELPQYEVAVTVLTAYIAFGVAEVLELSGVVSLFSCGAMLSYFNTHNLSTKSRLSIRLVVQTIALLCDKCAFAYLGVVAALGFEFDSTLWQHRGHRSWNFFFTVFGLILVGLSRAAFIFPFSFATNRQRPRKDRMNWGQQIIMWLAGLRGAVAFALAMSIPCEADIWRKNCRDNKELVVTTTLLLVVLTTVGVGSSLEYAVMTISRVYASKAESETSVRHTLSTMLDRGDRGLSATFLSHASTARSEFEEESAGFSGSTDAVLPNADTDMLDDDLSTSQDSPFLRWFAELDSKYFKKWFGGDGRNNVFTDAPTAYHSGVSEVLTTPEGCMMSMQSPDILYNESENWRCRIQYKRRIHQLSFLLHRWSGE